MRPVGEVLDKWIDRAEFRNALRASRAVSLWDAVVGPAIARRSEAVRVQGGRLLVRVADAAWMQEISMLRDEIRRKLNGRLGEPLIREIFLVSGSVSAREEPPEAAAGPRAPAEDDLDPFLPENLPPAVREAVRRLARARARRLRSG